MDLIPIQIVADKLGVTKDHALRLVRKLGPKLGIEPQRGSRNAVYLSKADEDKLIANYEPRRAASGKDQSTAFRDGFGYFYIIQLHPEELPNRLKFGYTDNMMQRLCDHRTTVPTLKLVKDFPCKSIWEDAARDSITRDDCTQIGRGEVYDGPLDAVLERAELFFELVPRPVASGTDTNTTF